MILVVRLCYILWDLLGYSCWRYTDYRGLWIICHMVAYSGVDANLLGWVVWDTYDIIVIA